MRLESFGFSDDSTQSPEIVEFLDSIISGLPPLLLAQKHYESIGTELCFRSGNSRASIGLNVGSGYGGEPRCASTVARVNRELVSLVQRDLSSGALKKEAGTAQ